MRALAPHPATSKTAAAPAAPGPAMTDNRATAVKQRNMQEAIANSPRQQAQPLKANKTGLPDQLKTGVENLSGHSLDDVRVHYNSAKPAQLQAHAYAQGTDIHVAPGQEQHLPHEAWHVVQQKQSRVQPTMQLRGAGINDNAGLEKEADMQGSKALSAAVPKALRAASSSGTGQVLAAVVQPKLNTSGKKTSGKAGSIKNEVTATIGRNKLGEMLEDIAILVTSINFRTDEQSQYASDKTSKEYKDHAGRIALETTQHSRLQTAYTAAKAAADAAKKAKAAGQAADPEDDGFTVVRRGR